MLPTGPQHPEDADLTGGSTYVPLTDHPGVLGQPVVPESPWGHAPEPDLNPLYEGAPEQPGQPAEGGYTGGYWVPPAEEPEPILGAFDPRTTTAPPVPGGFVGELPFGQPEQGPALLVYAGWWQRVLAALVDAVPGVIGSVIVFLTMGSALTVTQNPVTGQIASIDYDPTASLIFSALSLAWFAYNFVYLQGKTGQTVGKKIVGIKVLGFYTDQPIGSAMSFVRYIAHILDGMPCYLGYLWPIWDGQKRTFADMVCNTRVYKV